jgi:hypothetical protein
VLKDQYLLRTKHQQVRSNIWTQLGIFLFVQDESFSWKLVEFSRVVWCAHTKKMSSLSDHDDDCNSGIIAPKPPTNIDTANPIVETRVLNNPNPPRTKHYQVQVVDVKATHSGISLAVQ